MTTIHLENQGFQRYSRSKHWPQYLVVLTASLFSLACGLHFAWPSPSIPILLSEDYPLNITTEETSYIALVQPFGDILGAPLGGLLADVIGRKLGILLIAPPLFIGWIMIAFAQNTWMFCLARFISGIGDGFLFIVFPMYAGEVTEPAVRGILGCTLPIMMLTGMLLINILASYMTIQSTALICSLTPIIVFLIFIWMPESPYYLLMKGNVAKARKALEFLRRCDVTKELTELKEDVQRQMSERGTYKDLFFIDSNRKALMIMIGIRTMQQISGISALSVFTQTVFLKSNSNMSPVLSSVLYLLTQITVTILGSFLVDRFGRKPLMVLSSFLTAIVLTMGGVFFYLKEQTMYDMSHLDWMPVVIMISFVLVFGFGLGTVPTLMLGEMFSASIKGKALCIMCVYFSLNVAAVLKLFHFASEFGMYWPFFLFGFFCFINVIYGYFFVMETKGKTLETIQQELKGNKAIK